MAVDRREIMEFYKGRRVFVTGNTGFKGTWLSKILLMAGAEVTGYALEPPTYPSMFEYIGLDKEPEGLRQIYGDIRDYGKLMEAFDEADPEIVFHLAAQPIVRESYKDPRGTYEINVMGTVNICEAVRSHSSVNSFLNVTTDKVYKNNEWVWGYRETDMLDGFDPYSNSKSCSELVTHSYINSFFGGNTEESSVAVSTARAGNVIGGGDFASDRIVPDCVRACESRQPLLIRNPYSTRPYQHVLEPLFAYLMIAKTQYEDVRKAGFYNVGPDECDCVSTGEMVDLFERYWNKGNVSEYSFSSKKAETDAGAPHEAGLLKLDTSLIKAVFGWKPVWHIDEAIEQTVVWSKHFLAGDDISKLNKVTEDQIGLYLNSSDRSC